MAVTIARAQVQIKEHHMSLPKLLNAPVNSIRRMAALEAQERPLGTDDLPIERYRSEEDQAIATAMLPRSYTQQVGAPKPAPARAPAVSTTHHRPTSALLRAIAGRLKRRGDLH